MKLEVREDRYRFITDNTKECSSDTALVLTAQNRKYAEDSECCCQIELDEIKELFGIDRVKIIGVTGTNGKTTTSSLIYSMLLDLGYGVALQGTRGFFLNDEKISDYTLTTPSILETYTHIYRAVREGAEFFVMEVSSHSIAQNRIETLPFAIKIHTNITQDHLDYHGTVEEYRNVKNSFFSDDGLKLINVDDRVVKYNSFRSYTYSLENGSSFKLLAYSLTEGLSGMVQYFNEVEAFHSNLYGLFNLYNIMGAVGAVKLLTEKPLAEVCEVVDNFYGVAGRMEVVSDEPLVIVDFAHTPDGMEQVLNSLREKDIRLVFGAGGDRDRKKRPLMGAVAERFAKKIYLTSDNPRFEDPQQIVDEVIEGAKEPEKFQIDLNRKSAIESALREQEGDEVVLILGKGDETNQIIYDKKLPFDDRAVAREILEELQGE